MKKIIFKRVIAFAAALVISVFPLINAKAAASDGYWPTGIKIADPEETAFVLEEEIFEHIRSRRNSHPLGGGYYFCVIVGTYLVEFAVHSVKCLVHCGCTDLRRAQP